MDDDAVPSIASHTQTYLYTMRSNFGTIDTPHPTKKKTFYEDAVFSSTSVS